MLSYLPKSIQLVQNERKLEYQRVIQQLENSIIQDTLLQLPTNFRSIQGFHQIYALTQEEKEKLFGLVVEFICQKYIYKTQHLFQSSNIMRRIKQFLQGFTKKVSGQISIQFEEIRIIHNELLQNDLQTTFDNTDQKIRRETQSLQEFLSMFKFLVPPSEYPKLIHTHLQGEFVNPRLFRVVKSEPLTTYSQCFEELMDLKQIFSTSKLLEPSLLTQLIVGRPDLPIDPFINLLLEEIYNNFIQLLSSSTQQFGPLMQLSQLVIGQNIRLTSMIKNLVYLINPPFNNQRKNVWETIERMFNLTADLIHPDNVSSEKAFAISFFSLFIKEFGERVEQETQNEKVTESQENLFDNNILVKDETQCIQDEDLNELEEEIDEEDEEENDKELEKKDYKLDEQSIDKLITIVKPHLKYLIYQKDTYKNSVGIIFKTLCKLRPKEITPYLLDNIQLALERDDIKPTLIIYVIEKIFKKSIQIDQYPQIITYIPFIFRQTINFILDQGESIWRFYDILFQYIPIYDIKDLEIEYPNIDLKQQMQIADINFYEVTQEISDFCLEAFRKFVSTFEYNDAIYHQSTRTSDIIITTRNKFLNFVFQCSKSNYKEVVTIVCNYLDDKIINKLNDNLVLLLQAIIIRNPNILQQILAIIEQHLIRKNNKNIEFNLSNNNTIINYIIIIAEIIQFTGNVNKQCYQQIKSILDLSLQHQEPKVNQAGQQILYSLLLSQTSIHITDFSFSNDQQLQYDWLKLTTESKTQKYTPNWSNPQDQDFIKLILNDYYYKTYQDIIQVLSQKVEKKTIEQYLKVDFLTKLSDQYKPESNQQLEHKVRKNIGLNLEILYSIYKSIYYRMKQQQSNTYEVFITFQEQYCFQVLDKLYEEALFLCNEFVQLYINFGLSLDQRIVSAFNNLRRLFQPENHKLSRLAKWLNLKLRSSDTNKIKFYNRYQACMFFTFVLNYRINQLYINQTVYYNDFNFLLTNIPLMFDPNKNFNKLSWNYFESHLEMIQEKQPIIDQLQVIYEQMVIILKGKSFNPQHIDSLTESDRQKLSLFQNHILRGFLNIAMSFQAASGFHFYLDAHKIYESAYQGLIDSVFKSDFNLGIVALVQRISEYCLINNYDDFTNRQKVLTFKNKELADYVDNIFVQRIEVFQNKKQTLINQQELLNKELIKLVNEWLEVPIDQASSRILITSGCALFMMRNEPLPQLTQQVILKAFDCCISSEFNIRSFGRVLLYRLIQICIYKNKDYKYILRKEDDFLKPISLEEYNISRLLLSEDKIKYKLNDFHRKGRIFTYDQMKYSEIKRDEVIKMFNCLNQSDKFIQFCKLLMIDLSAVEQNQSQQGQQMMSQEVNYTNLFNDVDNSLSDVLYYNSNIMSNRINNQLQKIKFLKHLFIVTDYQFYKQTKSIFEDVTPVQQVEYELLQRLYLASLLQGIHSSWECDSQLQDEILEFSINQIEKIVNDQSRDQFRALNISMLGAFARIDIRKQNKLLNKILEKCKTEGDKIQRWLSTYNILLESKRYCKWPHQKELLEFNYDFTNSRLISLITHMIFSSQYQLPHNKQALEKIGLLNQFQQICDTNKQLKYFLVESQIHFQKGLTFIVQKFQELEGNCKQNIVESLLESYKLKNISLTPQLLNILLPIFTYLLTVNEGNNIQQLSAGLQIFTNIKNLECAQQLITYTLEQLKSSQNVVKIRQLNYLKNITRDILFIDRKSILLNIYEYLNDENKVVRQICSELLSQLIQQMNQNEQNEILEIFIKKAEQNETQLVGKQVLMSFVMAHPRQMTQSTNQLLKVILSKQGGKLSEQLKSFAAGYLKLYRANQLIDIEENQVSIELVEKMSELSNPYNYFA